MIDNIVSFEDRRLARLDGTHFSRSDEDVMIASTIESLKGARYRSRLHRAYGNRRDHSAS